MSRGRLPLRLLEYLKYNTLNLSLELKRVQLNLSLNVDVEFGKIKYAFKNDVNFVSFPCEWSTMTRTAAYWGVAVHAQTAISVPDGKQKFSSSSGYMLLSISHVSLLM